ncbi:hypothetical protein [Cellvibrio sp. PSBB023]|uniref:hypothetical protein n=1 Tax=Cellvibrio sp. PSBB023 TaxID=1945512 RepID=UPI00098FBB72|nr:hypothetical protein [Cellvibrio sp. PSBB023]AQT58702.1 hypothetical protein B0D95_00280 [Cellvibrio sp. PSBB023]
MTDQTIEELKDSLAALQGAYVVLVRYLAEQQQVYAEELCTDLDVLCNSHPSPGFQQQVMALSELVRSTCARLPKGDD